MQLALVHARFEFLETVRIPIAVIGNTVFPPLILLFFVVPNPGVAGNPLVLQGQMYGRPPLTCDDASSASLRPGVSP